MMTRIHSTTILISDHESSLDFSVNKLGWEKRFDSKLGPDHRDLSVASEGELTEFVLSKASDPCRQPGSQGIQKASH